MLTEDESNKIGLALGKLSKSSLSTASLIISFIIRRERKRHDSTKPWSSNSRFHGLGGMLLDDPHGACLSVPAACRGCRSKWLAKGVHPGRQCKIYVREFQ